MVKAELCSYCPEKERDRVLSEVQELFEQTRGQKGSVVLRPQVRSALVELSLHAPDPTTHDHLRARLWPGRFKPADTRNSIKGIIHEIRKELPPTLTVTTMQNHGAYRLHIRTERNS